MPPKPKLDHLVDPPIFPRAAQAIIWRNTFDRLGLPTQHFGHAALQLYESGERETFISWWPGGEGSGKFTAGGKGNASRRMSFDGPMELSESVRERLAEIDYSDPDGFRPNDLQSRRKRTQSLVLDYRSFLTDQGEDLTGLGDDDLWDVLKENGLNWMRLPEATVDIRGVGPNSRWGLHLPSITAWWKEWHPEQTYKMASVEKNCAGAVKLALRAGGSEWYKALPKAFIYSDPVTVEAYSREVATITNQLVQFSDTVERDRRAMRGMFKNVWTLRQFKSASRLGFGHIRSSLTRKIDTAVQAYDRVRNSNDTFKTYGALAGIMVQIMNHRRREANSARAGAIIELAGQVLFNTDEILRTDWGSTWHEDLVNLEARFRALKEPTEIT